MTNVFTLDGIRQALDKEFAPVEIEGVVLRNIMRLDEGERLAVMAAFEKTQGADSGTAEGMRDLKEGMQTMISIAGGKAGPGLVKKIGDDLAVLVRVTELWTEATSPGEASNSPV